ncbi:hypothetical protein [Porphyromonas gingivalis]|uniref:hypothetical protein n=1 Tax=Porphyromonas gingivalis TaxID=837 RepID=UPI000974FF55|nr:hypothetical protein [Porphyromonas gingivalis]PDP63995.1 hypothetical protein CLI80_06855 [Porphyromonas gingivalis]SJL28804.1 hypothetical protein PGIN_AFR-5B1_00654 [Porphyromonas gingivalis]
MIQDKILSSIESNLLKKLQKEGSNLVSTYSLDSPRSIGDAVQSFIVQHLKNCIPEDLLGKYENKFGRRSMEDLAFTDKEGNYYAIDVKTHNSDTHFNMPNLTSVNRLSTFYRNQKNIFCILMVAYKVTDEQIAYTRCSFKPIEHIDWSCLTLGALGWGQIQIKNSNDIRFIEKPTRKEWMIKMYDNIEIFYGNEILKINKRRHWFQKEKEYWNGQ